MKAPIAWTESRAARQADVVLGVMEAVFSFDQVVGCYEFART
jgi:hypothetical protein